MFCAKFCVRIYGILNAFFTTFPTLFEQKYGFGPGATGLTYIGGGLGELLSAVIMGGLGASIYSKVSCFSSHAYDSVILRN